MTFAKENAAEEGFNRWTIDRTAYPMLQGIVPASFHWKQGRRYRLRMRNASDDIHPIHLHRHSFELTKFAGAQMAGVMKDVVMLGGYQEVEVDFTADNPGLTLFHCYQQLHMDFGFMTLLDVTAMHRRQFAPGRTPKEYNIGKVGYDGQIKTFTFLVRVDWEIRESLQN